MKILYDHQIFSLQRHGGISRYFCELYSQLRSLEAVRPRIAALYSENSYHQELFPRWVLPHPAWGRYLEFARNKAIKKVNECYCKRQIAHGDFDVFHPTYYDPYFLEVLEPRTYVLTVYDMIHELFPDMFEGDRTAINKKRVVEGATKIIAISENTRADLLRFYDVDPQKIEVTHLATSLRRHSPDATLELPQKYLLFVGPRKRYKNFTTLVSAVARLLREERELHLICAGGGPFSADEEQLLDGLKIRGKVHHLVVPDDGILSQLYGRATLFVFPSLYEGFGIPVLEAFSCGCPVATSNCSSLPEVGGEAASYFDPRCADSIQAVVGEIVHDSSLRDSLRSRGQERLQLFSWEKTALKTKSVYDSLSRQ